MKRSFRLVIPTGIFLFFVMFPCAAAQAPVSTDEIDAVPCNPNASEDVKAVLKYLAALSSTDEGRAIAGQNCFHGDEITDASPMKGYAKLMVELFKKTGHYAAMVSVDYEYMKLYSPQELSAANKVLIGHWQKGGLVTITVSPLNPWVMDDAGSIRAPQTWDGPGSPTDRSRARLSELLDPSTSVYANWRKKLDRLATALAELRDAGVVVLWRPMQENNGNWFWWGADPDGYIKVYRDMYRCFTEEKKLDNLLWVYSPFGKIPDFRTYPGDDYVDIVAPTCYDDKLVLDPRAYKTLGSLGHPRKPMGMAEYGPAIGGPLAKKGALDDLGYIERIKKDYPRIAYWVSWHSYPGEFWSIVDNRNCEALMNHPDVITLDGLDWKGK